MFNFLKQQMSEISGTKTVMQFYGHYSLHMINSE